MERTESTTAPPRMRMFLWLSAPLALLAMVASAAGVWLETSYRDETASWAAQAVGQDLVNLAVYPALLVLAYRAARGSLTAHLAWLGTLIYSAYSYVIYAGYVHFSGMFLVYVAVLGLSVYALIGGLALLDPARVRAAFDAQAPTRLAARVLLVVGALFALMWIADVLRATLAGEAPPEAVANGLPVNVVHVLDLALLLPATLIAGAALTRRKALGYCLAAPLLTALATLTSAISAMIVSMAVNGLAVSWAPVVAMGTTGVVSLVVLLRLLRSVRAEVSLAAVLRAPAELGERGQPPSSARPQRPQRTTWSSVT